MERSTKLAVPALLGMTLAILLNKKKDAVTILIELVSGVFAAFYLAPYLVTYFNFPESITAFGVGTASAKICLSIHTYFNKKNPVDVILMNTSVSTTAQGDLNQTSKHVEQISIHSDDPRPEDGDRAL